MNMYGRITKVSLTLLFVMLWTIGNAQFSKMNEKRTLSFGKQAGASYLLASEQSGIGASSIKSYLPPKILKANVTENYQVALGWKSPSYLYTGWITHVVGDNLQDAFGAEFETTYHFLSRWTLEDYTDVGIGAGCFLSEIKYMPYSASGCELKIMVYQGGSCEGETVNVGTLVTEQVVTATLTDLEWNTIALDTPIEIDPAQELWFGFEVYQQNNLGYPMSFDFGPTNIAKDRNILSWNGEWYTLNNYQNYYGNCNFMLQGLITTAKGEPVVLNTKNRDADPDNYKLYHNNTLLTTTANLQYQHTNPPYGRNEYCVAAVYGSNESEKICVTAEVCTPRTLDIQESFEGEYLPDCWATKYDENSSWEIVSEGTGVECIPQDGDQMLRFNFRPAAWSRNPLISPLFVTGGEDQICSFWMYRDDRYRQTGDHINIYLTETGDITGATPLLTINRSMEMEPQVAKKGWYNYAVTLPCSDLTNAYVVIEGAACAGYEIYLDNISIGDACVPPSNIEVSLFGDAFPYNHVKVEWSAPTVTKSPVTGYNVYRNGVVIANNINVLEYSDMSDLESGEYLYGVAALYENDCGVSDLMIEKINVVEICTTVPAPRDVSAKMHTDEWYDIEVNWEHPTEDKLSYINFSPLTRMMGGTVNGDFMAAIRFTPEDLEAYDGKKLTRMTILPRAVTSQFVLKVWSGGGDLYPGTELLSQVIPINDLVITQEGVPNTIALANPITIDASQELWIGVSYEEREGYPAGMDNGPITKDRYSNLFFNDGQWMTAKEFDGTLRYNWYIMGHVKTIDDVEEVIGYNVYKENELLNTSNFVEDMFYNDNVPEGSHTYEISAIYEGLCESNRTPFVVEMPQSPCESEFTLPIRENFEGTRFPSWCWESVYSEGGLPWERVSYSQYPETYPDEGEYFMEHPWWGDTAWYISPLFTTEKDSYRLSLLMRRDGEYEFTEDKLNIYLSETPDVTGLTPIYSIHRYTGFEPPEAEEGWYEYTIPLNLAGMNNAYVILEGYAPNGGNNVYIDDIKIYDPYACDPIENLKVEQPREGEVFYHG